RNTDPIRRQVALARRQAHRERRTLALAAFEAHLPAVNLHELTHQRKPDAGALVGPRAGVAHALESLEHLRQLDCGDAYSGIANRQLDAVASAPQADLDFALERELESVREKIQNDLLPHVAVDVDRFGERLAIDDQRKTGAFDGRPEHARELGGCRGKICRL